MTGESFTCRSSFASEFIISLYMFVAEDAGRYLPQTNLRGLTGQECGYRIRDGELRGVSPTWVHQILPGDPMSFNYWRSPPDSTPSSIIPLRTGSWPYLRSCEFHYQMDTVPPSPAAVDFFGFGSQGYGFWTYICETPCG